jgi:hypothetical protein
LYILDNKEFISDAFSKKQKEKGEHK